MQCDIYLFFKVFRQPILVPFHLVDSYHHILLVLQLWGIGNGKTNPITFRLVKLTESPNNYLPETKRRIL